MMTMDVLPGSMSYLDVEASIVDAANLHVTGGTVDIHYASSVNITQLSEVRPDAEVPDAGGPAKNRSRLQFHLQTVWTSVREGVLDVSGCVSVTGNFRFENTDEDNWLWRPSSVLRMNGGDDQSDDSPMGYAMLEVGWCGFWNRLG